MLRQTFARVEAQAGIAGLIFYRNLFTLDPSLRRLFHTSIDLQSRKLLDSLRYTVATLENPRALLPELESMGRRHLAYGVREDHYDTVTRALLHTFGEVLGDRFSARAREAWRRALDFVASTMKRGAAQSVVPPG